MKDRTTGRARGFGFVAFADPAVVDRVLLEKHTVDGRMVEVKKAVRREEQQNYPRSNNAGGAPVSANSSRTKKIFVGGLASSVTEDDFRNYFGQFGMITDVVVMYDHTTQRPRGFGFITFDSEDAVENAMHKNFHELHDKMVEVKRAVPKELSAGRSGGGNFGQGIGAGRGAPYNTGYGQTNSSSPGNAYGGPHYVPPPSSRGNFSPYGPPSYGTPGYGPNIGYGVAMNGGYAGTSYGGGPGYPPSGGYAFGYGGAPGTGYMGVPAGYGTGGAPTPGYGSTPAGQRSPWGHAGSGFAGGGSPSPYGAGGVAGMNAYGNTGWTPGGAAGQSASTAAGYNSGGYGYGTNGTGYNSNVGGYPARSATGGPVGYNDAYAASAPYGDSSWRSGEPHSSPAALSPSGSGATTDATGYGVAGRQTQRGPDARFRPYPAAGERAA